MTDARALIWTLSREKGGVSMVENSFALVGGTVVPVEGPTISDGVVVVENGRITTVGDRDTIVEEGIPVRDVSGKWILPGLVDAHVHMGVYEEGEGWAGLDSNELTEPVCSHVRVIDAINPAELGFRDAISAGILAVNVNPGSGNPIGGQTAAIKCHGRTVDEMTLRAPSGIKSALGENPKRNYGARKEMPSTRLGLAAIIRSAFVDAQNYMTRRSAPSPDSPVDRNLKSEALSRVLEREIPWRQHCHRADDIATAIRMAEEFGYRLVLDHGTEANLLTDIIAAKEIPVIIGPLMTSRSKVEVRQRSIENPGKLAAAGVTIAITTDHPVIPITNLMYQTILAIKAGLDRDAAMAALTINPARIMGVDDRLGSLRAGKDADLCVWSGDPFDVYSQVEEAFIDGRRVYTAEQ